MDVAMKIVNSLDGRSFQWRLFHVQMEHTKAKHTELLLQRRTAGKFCKLLSEVLPSRLPILMMSSGSLTLSCFSVDMISAVNTFKCKPQLFLTMPQCQNQHCCQCVHSELERLELRWSSSRQYTEVQNIASEFEKCFRDFASLETVLIPPGHYCSEKGNSHILWMTFRWNPGHPLTRRMNFDTCSQRCIQTQEDVTFACQSYLVRHTYVNLTSPVWKT